MRAHTVLSLLGLLLLCGGCSASAQRITAEKSGSLISLTVQDGTYVEPGSAGRFSISTIETATGMEARVRVQQAKSLKAAYLELRYDPRVYQPAGIAAGPALRGAAAGGELLTLTVAGTPGVVYSGQVLPQWDRRPGFSGEGVIAVAQFSFTQHAANRSASTPPITSASAPVLAFDGPAAQLSWRFANLGDYNQDGVVGLADLTPLGIHFGESVAPGDVNTAQAVVDGNADGQISIGDIAPVGISFGRSISGGWHVYQSANAADYPLNAGDDNGAAGMQSVVAINSFDASTTRAADRVLYLYTLPMPVEGYHVWVRGEDAAGTQGIASNDVVLTGVNLPPIAGVTADVASGPPSLKVNFNASTSGDPDGTIVKWRWDPEGDGTYLIMPPNDPGSATLTYSYNTPGEFQPTVKVWDNLGAMDTGHTHVTVSLGAPELQLLDDGNGTNDVGKYPSVALVAGKPCVAYIDATADTVKYIQPTTSAGIGWGWPVAIADGANLLCSLADVNGRPAVCYDGHSNNIGYIRALDSEGYDWGGAPVDVVSGATTALLYSSLAVIDGRPAVAYCDSAHFWSGDAFYVRAADQIGSSWDAPHPLNSSSFDTAFPALGVVNGQPAVMYTLIDGLASWGLAYTHGEDSAGGAWSASRGVALGLKPETSSTCMVEVAGRPAVAFWDELDGMLKYVRALNAEGSEWGDIISVTPASYTSYNVSLAVINTLPAIAYGDSATGLMYVQAKLTTGSLWNAPVQFDPVGGMYPCLIEVNKRAGVAHYDANAHQLRFAVYH
jgi:hypothetical protein